MLVGVLFLWLLLLSPPECCALGVLVSPDCGTTATHFLVNCGGLPGTPKPCPDSCHVNGYVFLDGKLIYTSDCRSSFSIDLQNVPDRPPGDSCVVCDLIPGTHVVQFSSTNVECSGDLEPRPPLHCVQATFEIVAPTGIADPWAATRSSHAVGETDTSVVFLRFAADGCGFPPCDAVHLIQVVRTRGFGPAGGFRFLSTTEQGLEGADSLDAWTTPSHHCIDISASQRKPYITIGKPYVASKPGRIGAAVDTAQAIDYPSRADEAYPDTIVRIVLDFEINAFCARGAGAGEYLGRAIWGWERQRGAPGKLGRITLQPQGSLSQPTQDFLGAVERWAARTRFNLPRVIPPKKGGSSCQ